MIASIRGEVLGTGVGWVVILVGGMGFRVEVPAGRLTGAREGEQLALHTSLIVREDSLTLYGFETTDELEVFGHLLAVSGVGPRSALGVLSAMTPAEIAFAVEAEDEKPFKKVSGIGPKTAKLLAVSLAGKVTSRAYGATEASAAASAAGSSRGGGEARASDNVEQALVGLGYSESQAAQVVQDALDSGAPEQEANLLRAALALLQAPRPRGRSAMSEAGR